MSKKTKTTKPPRVSPKQQLAEYKAKARTFINSILYPSTALIFSIEPYNDINGAKKPNAISVPELFAIVGTAAKLGKKVQVSISNTTSSNELDFRFVNQPNFPAEL